MIIYKNKYVTVFQSPLFQTNATIIETNDMILVVDPNTLPQEIIEIRNYISNIRKERPVYLLFTHSDFDHILGYNGITNVLTIGNEKMILRRDKDEIVEQIKSFDDKYYLVRDYEVSYPEIDIPVYKDGQELRIGNTILTFYTSPGHTDDGLFAVIEPVGILFSGDYLASVEFPYIYYSSYEYENTMSKVNTIVKKHSITLLIPGHGELAHNCEEILNRKKESLKYIEELRTAMECKDEKRADTLLDGWQFPRIMREYHKSNKELIKEELKKLNN